MKLNDTAETLRTLQNRLILADFKFSSDLWSYLQSQVIIQHLGKEGDRFNTTLSHHAGVNIFVGLVQDFLAMEDEEMRGSLNEMTLDPHETA